MTSYGVVGERNRSHMATPTLNTGMQFVGAKTGSPLHEAYGVSDFARSDTLKQQTCRQYDEDDLKIQRSDQNYHALRRENNGVYINTCCDDNITHLWMFILPEDYARYLEGKMSFRFFPTSPDRKNDFVQHSISGIELQRDYSATSFLTANLLMGFKTRQEAMAFRSLCMSRRNSQEISKTLSKLRNSSRDQNYAKSVSCSEDYPYSRDELITSTCSHLLAVPLGQTAKNTMVYGQVWTAPNICLYIWDFKDSGERYVEVPLIPDTTLFTVPKNWRTEKDDRRPPSLPGNIDAVRGLVSPDEPTSPTDYSDDNSLSVLLNYGQTTREHTVEELAEHTLWELEDVPGAEPNVRDTRMATGEIDYSKVLQESVNISAIGG